MKGLLPMVMRITKGGIGSTLWGIMLADLMLMFIILNMLALTTRGLLTLT